MAGLEPESGEVFEIDRILRLVELMKEHDLSEVDLRQADQRIRLRRGAAGAVAFTPAPPIAATSASAAAAPAPASKEAESPNIAYIKSPMVGTFYSKSSPDAAKPYVSVGDNVDVDTVVCLIEAMKTYNPIAAEVRGKIIAVLVGNEEPVAFNTPLFKVDTSK